MIFPINVEHIKNQTKSKLRLENFSGLKFLALRKT